MGIVFNGTYNEEKFVRIPDRRLFSGLLTVNVMHHNENDGYDDYAQTILENWDDLPNALKLSYPWNNDPPTDSSTLSDFTMDGVTYSPRNRFKHSFGDYDVFLFFVAGGFTIQPIQFHDAVSESWLVSNSFVGTSGGQKYWMVDSAGGPIVDTNQPFDPTHSWHQGFKHHCQHFIKHNCISRFNNAWGHIHNDHKRGKAVDRAERVQVAAANSNVNEGGNIAANIQKPLYDNGIYDSTDSQGVDLGQESMVSGNDLNDGDLATYYSPVDKIAIYGKHNFAVPARSNGYSSEDAEYDTVYTSSTSAGFSHPDADPFWNMVIDVGLLGIDADFEGSNVEGNPYIVTEQAIKTRTNIFWQPFGETADFKMGDSEFTE